MEVFINGASHVFESNITLHKIVKSLDLPSQGVAIAVNKVVIAQSDWNAHCLEDQDQILVIGATQGG